jgi:hypothetical protein
MNNQAAEKPACFLYKNTQTGQLLIRIESGYLPYYAHIGVIKIADHVSYTDICVSDINVIR